eukprot:m.164416 g.164416  ORF g.164416 m.164416 type:complete len:74 (-) comp18111_c0_seq81:1091-1312(-)
MLYRNSSKKNAVTQVFKVTQTQANTVRMPTCTLQSQASLLFQPLMARDTGSRTSENRNTSSLETALFMESEAS